MFDSLNIGRALRKYKNRHLRELSTNERVEVLKLMDENLPEGIINIFVREDNGSVSSRRMSTNKYFHYLREKEGDLTVGQLIKRLQGETPEL